MRTCAEVLQAHLIGYEKKLAEMVVSHVESISQTCTDDELRTIARSGKLDLFMQKVLFDVIRKRRDEENIILGAFRKFLDKVIGK